MGSKTLENEEGPNGHTPGSEKPLAVGGEPRGAHTAREGDGNLGDDGGDDDDDDADEDVQAGSASLTTPGAASDQKKKKRKSKKKKKKSKASKTQTSPPRVPLSDLFPSGEYPVGELQHYDATKANVADENLARTTGAELRYLGRKQLEDEGFLRDYRKAAEVHRQARQWVQDTVKPGQTLLSIAEGIEDSVRAMLGNAGLERGDSLKSGMGFPAGLCLNHGAAHYTPNPGQKDVVLQHSDVMKVDFGVHINGWIVDSAFTMSFDPVYDNLLAAVKAATNSGIKASGIDVRVSDVSAAIQETMESYEVEIRGKTFPVKPVRNITAHNMLKYQIHGGKSIPFVKNTDQTKMEEGEVFAIETFGSTGRGFLRDDTGIYGYRLEDDTPKQVNLPLSTANRLYKTIRENFGTIVFCRRYLDRLGLERYLAGMNSLVSNGIVEEYKPLMDIRGSYSAQFEHTILLRESCKEVISRGNDY